jgi:hypothetical protein
MLLPSMGLIFSCTGVAMIYFTHEALPHLIGSTFLLAGLAILIFAFISNYSSIKYYYEKGLLKQYGREVQAEIINKRTENFNSKAFRSTSDSSIIIERDCIIEFRYMFSGKIYESESYLNDETLFNKLEIKQTIPVLVLPQLPETAYPRINKLKNLLKVSNAEENRSDLISVSQSLISDD